MKKYLNPAAAVMLSITLTGIAQHSDSIDPGVRTNEGRLSPLLNNLGSYHRPISTGSKEAQKFFDQGLILVYGFNHAEALRSFREAARMDPKCPMTYWGQALALAPNINDSAIGTDREQQGYHAIGEALKNKANAGEVEKGLIEAMAHRFTDAPNPDRKKLNQAYADLMQRLHSRFPKDPDVATLYADAVLNTRPWDYWSKDGKPRPGIPEAVAALEEAIRAYSDHPGAHHIYIHAVEASNNPDRAVPSADKLGFLVPGAGHLVHMPSHIYMRVGRYADASEANIKAIAADENYITQCRAQGIYPAAYYPHNIHFLFAALSMEVRSKDALEAANKMASVHGDNHLQESGFGLGHLLRSMPLFAMVRFGLWDQILQQPDPGDHQPFGRVIFRFARGLAFISKDRGSSATAELGHLRNAARNPELVDLKVFDLNDLAKLSSIAENLLAAEIAANQGKMNDAVGFAVRAVEIEDNLLYSEPPDWPIPARHFLGSILLRAGKHAEAESVYRKDLQWHRNNAWSLRGLFNSLNAQKKHEEAVDVERQLQKSLARADVPIESSLM